MKAIATRFPFFAKWLGGLGPSPNQGSLAGSPIPSGNAHLPGLMGQANRRRGMMSPLIRVFWIGLGEEHVAGGVAASDGR
jgi:hypothetical protein